MDRRGVLEEMEEGVRRRWCVFWKFLVSLVVHFLLSRLHTQKGDIRPFKH